MSSSGKSEMFLRMKDPIMNPFHRCDFTLTLRMAAVVAFLGLASTVSSAIARDEDGPPKVGSEAKDFSLTAIDGEKLVLSKLVEEGPVVLVVLRGFPGYQCPACSAQVGQLLSSEKKLQSAKTRVVLIYPGPADGLKKHAEDFVRGKTLPKNFSLVLDPDYKFTESYHLRWNAPSETAYPSTFVVGTDRIIHFAKVSKTHSGRATINEVLQSLKL